MPRAYSSAIIGAAVLGLALLWFVSGEQSPDLAPLPRSPSAPEPVEETNGPAPSSDATAPAISAGQSQRKEAKLERLSGRVESPEGKPIPDASVRWIALQVEDTEETPSWPWADWGVPYRELVETRTSSMGEFVFETPPSGGTTFGSVVVALDPRHTSGGLDLPASRSEWPPRIRIVLEPAEPIEVLVVDGSGRPQPDALVRHCAKPRSVSPADPRPLSIHEGYSFQEQQTDASGRVQLARFHGEQALWAEKDGQTSLPWLGEHPGKVRLILSSTFTLEGRVTLPDLAAWDPTYTGERRIQVSGLEGRLWRPLARLRDVGEGAWGPLLVPLDGISHVRARFEGLPIVPIEEEFPAPAPQTRKRIDFHAEKGADVWFVVKDESGSPIPTARGVAWWGGTPGPSTSRRVEGAAKPSGYLYIGSFPPGLVDYEITAPGFGRSVGATTAPSGGLEITLRRGGRVFGRCAHRGQPITDFEVLFWPEGQLRLPRTRTFLGRDDGTFDLGTLEPGDWWITAASSLLPAGAASLIRVVADQESRIEIDMRAPLRGVGRVVDAATEAPIPSASVQVYSSGGMEKGPEWGPPAPVSSDGSFDLDAFVKGANFIRVKADGYADVEAKSVGHDEEILDWGELRMHRPQALEVTLTGLEDLGFPPSELRATHLEGLVPEARFSSEGIARIEGVSPGDFKLLIVRPDETWTRLDLQLESGKEWLYEHKIAGTRRLSVRLREEVELSFPPVVMVVTRESETLVLRENFIREDGWARFEGIAATSARVIALNETGEPLASQEISFGEELSLEVELSIGDSPLRVQVLDHEGSPLPGTWVTARVASASQSTGSDDTDGDGWATLPGVPHGQILLDLRHPLAGLRPGIPIDASVREHELRLEASGAIDLRLVDGDMPLSGASIRILAGFVTTGEERADEQGSARIERLGEGTYHLVFTREDCWPVELDVALAAGERAERAVQMRRLADLGITVVSQTGLPVAGLPIEIRSVELDVAVADWLAAGRVQSEDGLTTSPQGKLLITGLPRGPYSWTATVADEVFTGTFALEPAKSNSILVSFPR